MQRRHLLGTLAVLAGTAGCLRLEDSGAATTGQAVSETSATATAAETTTATESDTTAETDAAAAEVPDYPSGLDEDGIQSYFADTHSNALSGESFTLRRRIIDQDHGSTLENDLNRVGSGGEALVTTQFNTEVTKYHSSRGVVWRQTHQGSVRFGSNPMSLPRREFTGYRLLQKLLRAGEFGAPSDPDTGGDLVTWDLRAEALADPGPIEQRFNAAAVNSFGADLTVDERGIVDELVAEFTFDPAYDDTEKSLLTRIETSDVGGTSVSEPSWAGKARERSPKLKPSMGDDRRVVTISHEGGDPVPAGAEISMYDESGHLGFERLPERIETGGRLDVWIENGRLAMEFGEADGASATREFGSRTGVSMMLNGAQYFNRDLR
ncbi:hypothetical protein [Haloarchaeobius sp. HME9146]|uniref:hypothetical protein n=1 Tax=Haloarchaeobius sp. HME9146 TaxID=2978732 RepID=UPI0021C1BB37|nr:hypothetical protein [Haloarchaeobius sp. HME9146]MCT9094567.1 hypothetical protein [Haloarchaeobius sp. HME9146]